MDDYLWELLTEIEEDERNNNIDLNIVKEDEKGQGNKFTYINRELIFSNRYERAIESLDESKICTRKIIESSRKILEHHHGDKYEDLYFIDSVTNKLLRRIDYKVREQEVMPTKAMRNMAIGNPNIISIHNHPTNTLPSYEDIKTCFLVGYKYGTVLCHNGTIYQYKTLDDINKIIYNSESQIYYKREQINFNNYINGKINNLEYKNIHFNNFNDFSIKAYDAGVLIKEVLWSGKF